MSKEKCKICKDISYSTNPETCSYEFESKIDWSNWIVFKICPKCSVNQKTNNCFRCGHNELCKTIYGKDKIYYYCCKCSITKLRNPITRGYVCSTCKNKDIQIEHFKDYLSYIEYTQCSGMCQECQDKTFK